MVGGGQWFFFFFFFSEEKCYRLWRYSRVGVSENFFSQILCRRSLNWTDSIAAAERIANADCLQQKILGNLLVAHRCIQAGAQALKIVTTL